MQAGNSGLDSLRVYAWDIASLSPTSLLALEAEIGALLGWSEGIPIVTCQRFEIVAMNDCAYLSAQRAYKGAEALLHLGRLASGLESLVLGEAESLGQVRSAFSVAAPALRSLVSPAIAAARSLRREASFDQHAGYALDLAVEHANLLPVGSLLAIGGGPMGRRVAERASQLGFKVTLVARRPPPLPPGVVYQPFSMRRPSSPRMCWFLAWVGRRRRWASMTCRPSGRPQSTLARRATSRPTCKSPSSRCPTSSNHTTAIVMTFELRRSLSDRLEVLLAARLAAGEPDSPLGTLRSEIERIRQRELMRSLRLHPDLPPDKLDTITRSLVNQLFHRPTQRLRQSADPELADALAALFRPRSQEEPNDGA